MNKTSRYRQNNKTVYIPVNKKVNQKTTKPPKKFVKKLTPTEEFFEKNLGKYCILNKQLFFNKIYTIGKFNNYYYILEYCNIYDDRLTKIYWKEQFDCMEILRIYSMSTNDIKIMKNPLFYDLNIKKKDISYVYKTQNQHLHINPFGKFCK